MSTAVTRPPSVSEALEYIKDAIGDFGIVEFDMDVSRNLISHIGEGLAPFEKRISVTLRVMRS